MHQKDAQADRPAVIMKVEAVFVDFELLKEIVDRLRQVVKGVRIRRSWRGVTLTEAWEVRSYQMIVCREQRDDRIELARGRRKPVQQHQRWRVFWASFPIEDPDAINRHPVIGRCSRRRLQRSGLRSMSND